MAEKTLEYFREKISEALNFVGKNPDMEIAKRLQTSRDMAQKIIKEIQSIPLWYFYMGHCFLCHPKKPKYDVAYENLSKFLEFTKENKIKKRMNI